uniref:Coat protein n=2 Tax=Caenorhabditis tropicalis TaxID=1561998 RepID=A0A1I7TQG4_9PELO
MSSITLTPFSFNPQAPVFIPSKPVSMHAKLVARFRLQTRLMCSMAKRRRSTHVFNPHATVFRPKTSTRFQFRARAPAFVPRSLMRLRSRFNVFAREFLPRRSTSFNPAAPIFIPQSIRCKWNTMAMEFKPRTRFNASAAAFIPKAIRNKWNIKAKEFKPAPRFNPAAKPFVPRRKPKITPNPASGGFVFNVGVANAPMPGVKTWKQHLDGGAFKILVSY